MEVRILGAHNLESDRTRMTAVLVDGVLALDAGGLSRSLSFEEQDRVEHILLTHRHYDHVRDIPAMGLYAMNRRTINVHASPDVLEALAAHMVNGIIYPRLHEFPKDRPALRFCPLALGEEATVGPYRVRPWPVRHAVPAWGFRVTSQGGKSLLYTGDTGSGFSSGWQGPAPDLLLVEVTAPNSGEKFALDTGHLTPRLLANELEQWQKQVGALPRVVTLHTSPAHEQDVHRELEEVAGALGVMITPAYERMRLEV